MSSLAARAAPPDAPRDAHRSSARRCPLCGARFRATRRTCAHDGTELEDVPLDPLIGATLGGTYRIDAPLGRGGMGQLYAATHLRLRRSVAVKVLHGAFADHDLALARFEREARAMARIRSSHVAQVLDVLRTPDGRPSLVVERLEGEDLQARLRRVGRLTVDEALALAVDLGHGLEAAHTAGVIHRDLKPSNVFLDAQGAKLLDFGVAHVEEEAALTKTGTVVGTPTYMAPEQVRGSAGVDGRADVYGAGAILYRALTGAPPYDTGPATAVLSAILESAPPPPSAHAPDLPLDVEAFVMRAMSRDPETRFASGAELAAEAARLLEKRRAPRPRGSTARATGTLLATGTLAALAGASAAAEQDLSPWWGPGATALALALLVRRWRTDGELGPRGWALARALRATLVAFAALTLLVAGLEAFGASSPRGVAPRLAFAALIGVAAYVRQRSRSKSEPEPVAKSTENGSIASTPSSSQSRPAIQRTPSHS
ncbi:MAG TPA: serine/threonine-protein kinase [Polyangiaceae bacterium LLY-WYZ-15_(1-7)]|nr:hypothetical protein [Myxococcales bacterium]MAT23563.1 hypothetical protein [Sandaracinus sp.]HJK92830.1 serine/threonine-protein kinase [Polyangiaceae bacterium LLY-WYZ-15_(1-7)]MBJ75243.1 hypothetical protein [Sandaracinus sp.]HJL06133.1 serine/threonine-protein kinase [Polyangiaceae bacterium LLY-WYZ-15_(1-7)]